MGVFDVRKRDFPGRPSRAAAGFGDSELDTFGHLDTRTMLGRGHRVSDRFANRLYELTPKRLELLTELVPQARVIGFLLVNPARSSMAHLIEAVQRAAAVKGVQLAVVNAGNESEIDAVFASLVRRQAGGLVVAPDPMFSPRRDQLAALTSRHALPATYHCRAFVLAGGLMSYAADFYAVYRQAGVYAGRILKGERPADLPVQQPTKIELAINLKTAKALGITVPPAFLARADELIE